MFDVLWTDPDRELVGEHRAKKKLAREKQQDEKQQEDRQVGASQPSISARESSSSSKERAFGFFGSRNLRKAVVTARSRPSSNSSALLAQAPSLQRPNPPNPQESPNRDSDASGAFPDLLGQEQLPERVPERHSRNQHISYPSSRDSAFSKWTDRTVPTNLSPSAASFADSAKSSAAHAFGQSPFIAQSTEGALEELGGAKSRGLKQPQSAETGVCSDEPDEPVNLFPGPKSPLRSIPREWTSAFKPNNVNAWKTPAAWNSRPVMSGASGAAGLSTSDTRQGETQGSMEDTRQEDAQEPMGDTRQEETQEPMGDTREEETQDPRELEIRRMRQELEAMAAADSATMLGRLREPWGEMREASRYKEAEMEKKMWMLTALYHLDEAEVTAASRPPPPQLPRGEQRKVLALHESHATTSFLATICDKALVCHLAASPMSSTQFPNIHPMAMLPTSRIFSAAYSLALPSHVSRRDMQETLKRVHQCLLPGAYFYLALINAEPVVTSRGPLMQAWLEKHLLFNLEKKQRCATPSMFMSRWLADSSLRGKGSVVSKAKFLAITPDDIAGKKTADGQPDDQCIRTELRGEVGRMLWKEVWGVHVEAERWWWEEPAIVEECLRLRTFWDYYLIESANES